MNLFARRLRQAAASIAAAACGLAAQAALPTVPTPVEAAPAVGASSLLQAGFGMFAVLGLIFLCAWAARRFGLQRLGGGQFVKVVSSTMVGQRERVVVVEVGGTWLVLGIAAGRVNALHSLPAQAVPPPLASAAPDARLAGAASLFAQKLRDSLGLRQRPTP
ncbi:putative flagellar biosynthetic protein FliO [Variovorax paradoxus B4]|uniref:Flagellar protein n=1 Tax=Variovorax paradoxus B4 TaxID=1246301 RepID=T1XH01_VARPD|nr:flagellar biosynthetic protein FliO [Variovorax paradoxus]AGU51410.1 putative flagellar biosynthetic protein FliO [Variovorax paradoxus B4]